VVTRPLKRGAVWRIDFKKKEDFGHKYGQCLLLAIFRQNKKKGCTVKSPTPYLSLLHVPTHQINFILQTAQNL